MPQYIVKAHVSVIAQAQMAVEADTPQKAMAAAKTAFDKARRGTLRRDCVVHNSVDESHPFDFEPLEALPVESANNLETGGPVQIASPRARVVTHHEVDPEAP